MFLYGLQKWSQEEIKGQKPKLSKRKPNIALNVKFSQKIHIKFPYIKFHHTSKVGTKCKSTLNHNGIALQVTKIEHPKIIVRERLAWIIIVRRFQVYNILPFLRRENLQLHSIQGFNIIFSWFIKHYPTEPLDGWGCNLLPFNRHSLISRACLKRIEVTKHITKDASSFVGS